MNEEQRIAEEMSKLLADLYNLGLKDGGNDALEYAAKLAEADGKATRLSEEIRSLKK
jgi:hypothetical protein